jgi:Holliday junction resolvase
MVNRNKIKGSAYETKIVKILSEEFNLEFRRVPLSGAIDYLKGDIWTPKDTASWPYCIECKHYASVEWNNLLTAKTTDMLQFWRQTIREAEVMDKKPLLIFRWNRSKDFVAYNDDILVDNYIEVKSFDLQFKVSLLDDWLRAVKKQTKLAK